MNKSRLSVICFSGAFFIVGSYILASVTIFRNETFAFIIRDLIPVGFTGFTVLAIILGVIGNALLLYTVRFPKGMLPNSVIFFLFWINLAIVVINWIFVVWEFFSYENFIFGTFGVYLHALRKIAWVYLATLSLVTYYSINAYRNVMTKIVHLIYQLPIIQKLRFVKFMATNTLLKVSASCLPLAISIYIINSNLSGFPQWVRNETRLTISNMKLPPQDRYELGLKDFHIEMQFVEKHTPRDAIIFHPLQSEAFPIVGNQVLIRFHLFPRRLVSEPLIENFLDDYPETSIVYSILDYGYDSGNAILSLHKPLNAEEVVLLMNDDTVRNYSNILVTEDWSHNQGDFKIGVIKYSIDTNTISHSNQLTNN